jgi:uncharacterized protein (DUF736 family)
MIIGKFTQQDGGYTGSLPAFTGQSLSIRIAPTDQKGVDYLVTLSSSGIELGVAWNRTSKKGNAYVSVKLDSPFLPAPANCSLIKQTEGYALLWERAKPKADDEAVDCGFRRSRPGIPIEVGHLFRSKSAGRSD